MDITQERIKTHLHYKMNIQPKVTIIIVTYNSDLKLLRECLDSLKKVTDYNNYKVIISDNGSINGSNEMIKKDYKWVDLIENNANIYFAGGCNSAIKYALKKHNLDYVLLLNDDTKIVQSNWLKKIVKVGESDKKIGILGCKLIYPDGRLQHVGGFIKNWKITKITDFKEGSMFDVDHVMGAFMLIRKEVIETVGLFDEIFTPYLLDETDYCMRTKNAGFKIVSKTDIKIIHHKGVTIDRDSELKRNYVRLKNDIIFSLINMKLHYGFIRVFFYLPLVAFFKKKDEKGNVTVKNAKLKDNFFKNVVILIKGYWFMLSHLKLIYKKRLDRKRKIKIWC